MPASVILVKKKSSWEVSTFGKTYAGLVILESLCLLVLASLSLWYAHTHANEEEDANSVEYTSIVAIVASLALLYFALDSILLENVFQFYVSQFMHGMITGYVIYHYLGNGGDLGLMYNRISLYVMIGVCIFQGAYLALLIPVQRQFGWRLYKKIGGNMSIRPLYRDATILFSLLKLDFALGLMLVLLAVFYLVSDPIQIVLNILACVMTLVWLILGFTFVQRESHKLGIIFFMFATLEPAFVIYKLIAMKLNNPDDDDDEDGSQDDPYPVFSWTEFLATGCIALIVRFGCIVYGIICTRNFDKGLKEKMWQHSNSASGRSAVLHSPLHTQAADHPSNQAHPIIVVRESEAQGSSLRSYIQPLL